MNARQRLSVTALVVLSAGVIHAEPARYMRHPALSPDGQTVAFAYRGDIWVVATEGGTAHRLTVHPARDQRPVWSPDGTRIAFASDREGQNDIYRMPAAGGAPVRMSFNTGDDFPCDWSPDGKYLLVQSARLWRPDLFELPIDGGPARPVTTVPQEGEYHARYSGNGRTIVFCDGAGYVRWWWEGLRSGRAGQVWTLVRNSWPPRVKRVSPEGTQFLWPGFVGTDIIATSNAGDVVNIVRFDQGEGEPIPVTSYTAGSVKWLRVARDGSKAVFERLFRLWTIDLVTDSVTEIVVEAPSDWVVSPRIDGSIEGKIEEFALSPDGRRIALVAGGEVYLIPAEDATRARRLTRTDARERFVVFSPDGREVAFVSDRTGRQNLYVADTRSGDTRALTALADTDVARPQWSPTGDRIAFYMGNDRIASVDPSAAAANRVDTAGVVADDVDVAGTPVNRLPIDTLLLGRYFDFPLESTQEFRFSPDGRYIAYTAFGPDYDTDIWIHGLDGSINVNTTRWSKYNYDPRWSPDGRYLSFVHAEYGENALHAVRLDPDPPEFALSKLDSLYEETDEADNDEDSEELPDVELNLDRIHTRWQTVFPMADDQGDLVQTSDGKYWLFVANLPSGANIWRVPVKNDPDQKPKQLTSGSKTKKAVTVDPDSKWVYYLQAGHIGRVSIEGEDQELISFAADYDYHPTRRNEQKLTEAWRVLGSYFYDPGMHGASWDSLRVAYTEILPHIAVEDELRDLMKELIGQLNSSHLNVYGGLPGLPSSRQSGYLGAVFDPEALREGVYRVDRIQPDGPVARADVDVARSDTLVGVNGDALTRTTDLDSMLAGTIGERVRLTWRGTEGEYQSDIKPVSKGRANTLLYEDWVETRRRLVDSLSDGRLGYLHIRAMNQPALDRFKRELADQTANYDGLVIDVRFNGGGWISVHLLGMLERQPYVLRNFRGAATVSENKSRSFAVEKPMILLVNHFSASNSEIFAEGWRTLGLGKIVGYPTSAAVIGTSAYRLIDGTICRRPSWGAFAVDMENLEGNPRRPDIEVFNTQYDWNAGRDPQLEAAVEEMLADLR